MKDLDECEYRCYLNANCVSLNIKNKDPHNETHECELNNSTHLEHDWDLKDSKLYYYRGAEVSDHQLFHFWYSNEPIHTQDNGHISSAQELNIGLSQLKAADRISIPRLK